VSRKKVLVLGGNFGRLTAALVPPFVGQEVVFSAAQIADDMGYVKVRDTYPRHGYIQLH
jgi:hypothetical protein